MTTTGSNQMAQFIGKRRVCEISGFSPATIHRKIKAGEFPSPVIQEKNKKGEIAVCRWDLQEIMAWRQKQFQNRDERMRQAA